LPLPLPEAAKGPVDPEVPEVPEAPPAVRTDGKVILGANITPRFLLSFYAEHTSLQAERLAAPFIDKWLQIKGTVSNVSSRRGDRLCLNLALVPLTAETLGDPLALTTTLLYFEGEAKANLEVLQLNDQITAIGKIREISHSTLVLNECELVAVG
jgi:hypothetical protein